jgi:hypothetical protein
MRHNQPLEWTGRRSIAAQPPHTSCLPLRGSVIRIGQAADRKLQLVPIGSTMEG